MPTESMTYVASCACGGVVMMAVDDPKHKQDVARHVQKAIKYGLTVDRITTEAARQVTFCENGGKCKPGEVSVEQGNLF